MMDPTSRALLVANWRARNARRRRKAALTAHRKVPMPPHRPGKTGRPGWCKWCDREIIDPRTGKPHRQRMWHPECANEWELFSRAEVQRAFLIGRDGEACRACGIVAPMRWLPGPVMQNLTWRSHRRMLGNPAWLAELWERPEGASFADFRPGGPLHGLGDAQEIERVTALQVDHIRPLWSIERTADWAFDRQWWSPANLQLLCPACHKAKCAQEARERARRRVLTGYQHRLI